MQILISGMHRSGTSAVSRILNMMGAYFAAEGTALDANEYNPKGYWERKDVMELNDTILKGAGATWCKVSQFSLDKVPEEKREQFIPRAQNILLGMDAHRPWVIKDPRFSFTLPLWQPLLELPVCVLVYRHPIQVAQSLKNRDLFPLHVGIALWESYNLAAINACRDMPTIIVSFQDLIENPVETVTKLYDELITSGIQGIRLPLKQEILSFLDPNLQRHRGDTILEEGFLNSQQKAILSAFEERKLPQNILKLSSGSVEILQTFEEQFDCQIQLEKIAQINTYDDPLNLDKTLSDVCESVENLSNKKDKEVQNLGSDVKNLLEMAEKGSADIQHLTSLVTQLESFTEKAFTSMTWKIGHGVVEAIRKLTRREPEILIQARFKNTFEQFTSWKESCRDVSINENNSSPISASEQDGSPYEDIQYPNLLPSEIKLIAFYLPQFHPIPENDKWWGKGFTEWTNVTKAKPQYEGHYQPRLPGELGYYDLRAIDVQKRQIELAKQYGIYGFCYHHYWFGGKRLLEGPFNRVLANPELDLPFCLCWANENWTRRWDGMEQDVLIKQNHSPEDDIDFIKDIEPALRDSRYIRVDGKPLLIVYRVDILPNAKETAERWRQYSKDCGIGELYLVAAQSFGITDPQPYGFDAAVEFPPHNFARISINATKNVNPRFKGDICSYADRIVDSKLPREVSYPLYRTIFPSWDNTARKNVHSHIFADSSPRLYGLWLENVIDYTISHHSGSDKIVFINAWNEWAEGAHLEPDGEFGYAYLNKTAELLNKFPIPQTHSQRSGAGIKNILFISHDAYRAGAQLLLIDLLQWIKNNTNIQFKIILGQSGAIADDFKSLSDCLILEDLQKQGANEAAIQNEIKKFCDGQYDCIYANTVVSGDFLKYFTFLNAPILTHVHELEKSIQRFASAETMGNVTSHTNHYIAASPPVKDNLVKNHGIPSDKVSVVNAFIKPTLVPATKEQRIKARNKLGLPLDAKLIFGCGSLDWRKGVDIFIEVASLVKNQTKEKFHFYWIGAGSINDPIDHGQDAAKAPSKTFKELAKELDILDYVTFLGEKPSPRDYFMAGDIFALTSREDPFPLVCLEAANCANPILCFEDRGGMPGFVETDAGFVVPYPEYQTMADKIVNLLEDERLCTELGSNAHTKLFERHVVSIAAPDILDILQTRLLASS